MASAAISGEQVDPPIEPPTTTLPPVVQAPLNPEITLSAEPNVVIEGQQSRLTVTFKDVNQVSYMCTDRVSHEILASQ